MVKCLSNSILVWRKQTVQNLMEHSEVEKWHTWGFWTSIIHIFFSLKKGIFHDIDFIQWRMYPLFWIAMRCYTWLDTFTGGFCLTCSILWCQHSLSVKTHSIPRESVTSSPKLRQKSNEIFFLLLTEQK